MKVCSTIALHLGRWLLVLGLVATVTDSPAQTTVTPSPWSRIVVIGASASAGFVMSEPFGGTNTATCRLHHYLDAAVIPPHEPIKTFASALFFLQPEAAGRMQVEQALKLQPSIIVGVDFLFWFCYGTGTNDAQRAQRFDAGLKLLEAIPCPLVIGDIPDASFATNTGILSPAQVPSPAARTAANQRLKAWAATRPQVAVVPLANFMQTAMANQALTIHGQTLSAGKTRAILQSDALHPNSRGAALLALGTWDTLTKARPEFSAKNIRWDLATVQRLGLETVMRPRLTTNAPAAK